MFATESHIACRKAANGNNVGTFYRSGGFRSCLSAARSVVWCHRRLHFVRSVLHYLGVGHAAIREDAKFQIVKSTSLSQISSFYE